MAAAAACQFVSWAGARLLILTFTASLIPAPNQKHFQEICRMKTSFAPEIVHMYCMIMDTCEGQSPAWLVPKATSISCVW